MIIVFGAAGFVGSYLLEELPTKSYLAVDAKRCIGKKKVVCLDITKPNIFAHLPTSGVECVVNLASLQPDYVRQEDFDPVKYLQVNTIGAINIAKYCINNNIPKMIHVISHRSVIETYDAIGSKDSPITESDPVTFSYGDEFAEFAISEMAAVQNLYCYRQKKGLNTVILRIPAVFGYGPHLEGYQNGQYKKTGFQTFIEAALSKKPICIWGDPSVGRDIIYVKDVVSAIMAAVRVEQVYGIYNIASGQLLALEEEVKEIINVFSPNASKHTISYDPSRPNGIKPCLYSIAKARRDLNWWPKYSFREMLLDYRKEWHQGRFDYLVEGRKEVVDVGT